MSKFFFRLIAFFLIATLVVGLWLRGQFFGSAVDSQCEISIGSEAVASDYEGVLEREILPKISSDWAFKFYAKYLGLESSIKPGRYLLQPGMSVMRVVRMLKLGEQVTLNVTFNNVRTMPQLAGKIASQLDVDSLQLVTYLQKEEVAKRYGFNTSTLFAMFIPNTYEFYWNTTPEKFVDRMASEFRRFWNEERIAKAKKLNLSQTEVMTLASIVYEETKQRDEMPRVAGVYINRLRVGMPLQADPTVKYAVQDFSLKRVLNKHLKFDSPYNTYLYRGLPPSPIAMPSIAAIDAVLNVEKHSYFYFCARPTFDGYHNFAKSLSEHNRNARAYINELNRRKIK